MKQYRIFILAFCLTIITGISFAVQYIIAFRHLFQNISQNTDAPPNPFVFFDYFLSPLFIGTILVLAVFSLLYRILGILFVARNKSLQGGEQALWIIGFIFVGFITGIIFMALAKSKHMIVEEPLKKDSEMNY